jgi:hypothetical protein
LVVPGTKRPKRWRTWITHLWSNVHNPSRVTHIVVSRPWTPQTGCLILMGSFQRLRHDGPPQVLGHSIGELVHPIFIGSTRRSYLHPQIRIEIRMGRKIVPISLLQPTIIGLLKIKKEIIIFNSRKIITYEIKWLNEHTTKCWVWLSTNCCTPFWWSSLRTCVSTNSSIELSSRPTDIAYKKKINQVTTS